MSEKYPYFDTISDGTKIYVKEGKSYREVNIVNLCAENGTLYLLLAGSLRNNTDCKYTIDEINDLYKSGIVYLTRNAVEEAISKEI